MLGFNPTKCHKVKVKNHTIASFFTVTERGRSLDFLAERVPFYYDMVRGSYSTWTKENVVTTETLSKGDIKCADHTLPLFQIIHVCLHLYQHTTFSTTKTS